VILIVTNKEDITADFFITKANACGLDYFRLNTEDFPTLVTVVARLDSRGAWEGYISDEYRSVSLLRLPAFGTVALDRLKYQRRFRVHGGLRGDSQDAQL
jgi:hypothetical protein